MLITSSTGLSSRRFMDSDPFYRKNFRKLDIRPNTGTVNFRTSVDGSTYQTVKTWTGTAPEPVVIDTFNLFYEIECVGDAQCRITGGL